MRLKCPLCGDRDRREFTSYGAKDCPRGPLMPPKSPLRSRSNPD
jgi:sarcosine oxidase delta subunit